MTNFLKTISLSVIISTVFYYPLIKLYNYLEDTSLGGTEIEEE